MKWKIHNVDVHLLVTIPNATSFESIEAIRVKLLVFEHDGWSNDHRLPFPDLLVPSKSLQTLCVK